MKTPDLRNLWNQPTIKVCGLLAVCLMLVSCKAIQKVEFKPPPGQISRHNLRVALVLETNFCHFEHHRDPEGYVYPLGDYLCKCATHVAQGGFSKVTMFETLEAALKSTEADAVLIPKVVKIEIRARGVAWEKRHTLVVIEWSMKNLKDQKTVWLATVEGRAEGKVGTMFSMDKKDRVAMQQAMDDLCRNSVAAFNRAEEIRSFASSQGRVPSSP